MTAGYDVNQKPDFLSSSFLEKHIRNTLAFYEPQVYDKNGGFFQHFRAYQRVVSNKGAAGVDQMPVTAREREEAEALLKLRTSEKREEAS